MKVRISVEVLDGEKWVDTYYQIIEVPSVVAPDENGLKELLQELSTVVNEHNSR